MCHLDRMEQASPRSPRFTPARIPPSARTGRATERRITTRWLIARAQGYRPQRCHRHPHSTTACHRASLPDAKLPSPLATAPLPPAARHLACRSPPRTHTDTMAFALPPLPYAYDALEPYIDSTTVRLIGRTWGLGLGCGVATSAADGGLLWCLRMLVPVRAFFPRGSFQRPLSSVHVVP